MNKTVKKILIGAVILLVLLALFLVLWAFVLYPNFFAPKDAPSDSLEEMRTLAEESDKIDFDESEGMLYINNEVVVFFSEFASESDINSFLSSYSAEIDTAMADIGVYKLIFKDAKTYDELESLVSKIKSNELVDDAYVNVVSEFDGDETTAEDEFIYQDPAYPNDPWNGNGWNVSVPRGENWGMEAIDAPGAWGYLDQLESVNVGLIDSMPSTSHKDLKFSNTSCLFIDEKTGKTTLNKHSITADDHGTHVAGTMNAKWNNKQGVTGVMGGKGKLYYSAIYYEHKGKVTTKFATAYSYLLALKTLIDQDVQVINISQNTSRLIGFAASHGNKNAKDYLTQQANLAEKGLLRIIAARAVASKPDFVICVAAGNSNSTYFYRDDEEVYGYRSKMTPWEIIKHSFGWRGEKGGSLAKYNNFLNLMDEEEVKNRVIVVGAIGIDKDVSTSRTTRYSYAYFSNIGSRVDVVAPGFDVYSCVVGGYDFMSGTSMATPHVSGVAGLIFSANPSLSGPDVKRILLASTTGRYYHGDSYSGLLNANTAVVNALKTEDTSVDKVLQAASSNGLDLCFVVDTTGSMGDDIDNAKSNMSNILTSLGEKTENYRVALIDYRDFADRAGSQDYPCKVQLPFTDDDDAISAAINDLDLGNGGDDEETVYSALMAAVDLDWRKDAKKVIIILGDAAPLDPEPETNYTYEDVLLALFNADINIDIENSDDRVVGEPDASLINVFSIGANASSDAADFFEDISGSTGGSYVGVEDASEVSNAIMDSIDQIKVSATTTVDVDFGKQMDNAEINLYLDGEFLFTLVTDEHGKFTLESMPEDTYRWTSNGLYASGTLKVDAGDNDATIRTGKTYWFTPILQLWHQQTLLVVLVLILIIALCIATPIVIKVIKKKSVQKKAKQPVIAEIPEVPPVQIPDVPKGCICQNCGTVCEEDAAFCSECGAKIGQTP